MDSLFTPEVIERILSVLETAADGSVDVLIVYFLIPLLVTLVISGAWLSGVIILIKAAKEVLVTALNREKIEVTKMSFDGQIITGSSGVGEPMKELMRSVKGGKGDYVHKHHIQYLRMALENQRMIDKKFGGGKYNPHSLKSYELKHGESASAA